MFDTENSPKIFITHSWHDIEFARRLYNDLKARGFDIWFDDKTLQAGYRMAEEINRGLEWCDVYIPVISTNFLISPWCWEELNAAISLSNQPGRSNRPRIIPVIVEACQMPALLSSRLYINFADRYDAALGELLQKGLGNLPSRLTPSLGRATPRIPSVSSPAQHSVANRQEKTIVETPRIPSVSSPAQHHLPRWTIGRMFAYPQRIGRSLMLLIVVLSAVALPFRFGQPDLLNINWLADAGSIVFGNLPILCAIGVAVGFTSDIGSAGLAGMVCYIVLNQVSLDLGPVVAKALGSTVAIDTGVISAIISGMVAASLYERFHETKLPEWLAFFGGRRFVPIVAAFAGIVLGLIFAVVWPPIQVVLFGIGTWAGANGAIGAAVHAFLSRLLYYFGLNHVLNSIVWFELPPAAGLAPCLKDGKEVLGDLNRFFANCQGNPGIFMTGFFPIMLFGLPAAALAMYHTASDKGKKAIFGVMLSAALTSFVTGITEPIEFAFMFVAPVLYVVHAVLTGISAYITVALGIRDGFGFSAGITDYLLNFTNPSTHQPILLLIIGVVFGVIYYFVFRWLIVALNVPTPGREPAEVEAELTEEGLAGEGPAAPAPAPAPVPPK